ncbi:hypothetical protein D3C87_1764330 [compost metagenome]
MSREEAWELVALEMANTPLKALRHYPRLENFGGPSVPKPNDRGTQLFSEDLW